MGRPPSDSVPIRRFAVLLALAAGPALGQSVVDRRAGPVVSLDLAGGAFPAFTPAGVDASGALGYTFGNGLDATLLLGYGGAVADTLFPYPPEVHVGVDLSLALGPERAPWRLSATGLASVSGSSTFVFPADGGPTETPGGPDVIETRARASVLRFVGVLDRGGVRVLAGGGAFAAVRRIASDSTVYNAGGPDERVRIGEPVVETRTGAVIALPVAVRLGERATLVLDPELRVGLEDLFFGVGDGQVTLRLGL